MTLRVVSGWRVPAAVIAILVAMCATAGRSQETRGSIQGRVVDASGAVVPGAEVAAVNIGTNISTKASTNQEGLYTLYYLLPGVYSLSVTAPGFKTAQKDKIEIRINDRLQVDFTLEVGEVTEQVKVVGEPELLQTATANLGQVIDTKRLADLPVSHGSPFNLLFLAPGVVETDGWGRTWQETSNLDELSGRLSFNGAPAATSDWTIDGAPNVQSSHGTGPMNSPPVDIVQEFKLETAFDASVGHTSGTIVNVSIKSGANEPHGTASGFFRNPDWDANTFFGNRAGQKKPTYAYKRWGATLNGPVYIPKVFNGKDRTFFAYAYEGVHRSESFPFVTTVPDPKHVAGDFSGLLAVGNQYQIYDPSTIAPAAGGRFSRQPFPGNIIPASRINPIAKNILSHYPKPNAPGGPNTENNFELQTISDPDIYYNHTARIDHNLSNKQRLFGRITGMRRRAGPYRNYYDDPAVANNFIGRTKQITVDDVYTFSPSSVLNVRVGVSRFSSGHSPRALGFDPAKLGFPPNVVALLSHQGPRFPRIDISGLMSIGHENETIMNTDIYYLTAGINKQHNRHNMKFGSDIRVNKGIDASFGQKGGRFVFGTDFTRGPLDNSPASPRGLGQGLASLLLGLPTGGLVDVNDSQAVTSTYWSFYFHDNWRVTSRLTLDLGLRWEYEGPVTERFNRSVRGFDPAAAQRIEAQAKARYAQNPDQALSQDQFRVRGGLLFAGVGGQPRLLWERSLRNFAPRIGFAYQAIRNKVVLRGGYGIYPICIGQPAKNYGIQHGFSQATELIPTLDNGLTFIATLADPFPSGLLKAPGASLGVETFLGRSISFYNPIPRAPYTQNWNFNIQTMAPARFLIELGYTGSKSLKLQANRDMNAIPLQYLSKSFFRDQVTINYLSENIPNPFAGLLPGTGLNGKTIPRYQLLRPLPHFSGITMLDYQGYAWYHALQARAERRLNKGLTVQVGYSFSKRMEAVQYLNGADPVPYESLSSIDRPQQITLSALYELPIGRGRAVGTNFGRLAEALIGGWEIGAVWQFQSGFPLGFGDAIFVGDIRNIPLPSGQRTVERWFNIDAGFVRDSRQARSYNVRTFPLRFAAVRSQVHNSWDLSLLKNFQFRERHRAQFRTEFFNAFNHPTGFMPPNTNPYSSAFGQVTSQFGLPRQIQFGVKYLF